MFTEANNKEADIPAEGSSFSTSRVAQLLCGRGMHWGPEALVVPVSMGVAYVRALLL